MTEARPALFPRVPATTAPWSADSMLVAPIM